jgi:hypothetical protein
VVNGGGSLCALLACAGLMLPGAGWAEESRCGTWFPDFGCDREARPDGSVIPISFPYLFEDPYITSGLNFVGIWHEYPDESVFAGGQIGVLALQIRLAITERLAFIATKDGLAFHDPDNALLENEEGFFNLGLGFKYAAWSWKDGEQSAIVTPSLRYEIPSGQDKVYQGTDGDGIIIPAVSGAYQHGSWHVIAALGGNAAIDGDKNSNNFFYNLHIDHAFEVENRIVRFVVPFIELNAIHWTASGDGSRKVDTKIGSLPIGAVKPGFEGSDVINLGNTRVSGNDYITMAWGVRFPMEGGFDIGASYERPLSNHEDITEQRVTLNITWEF